MIQRAIWVFVACCIVVAVWNSFPHNPKGFYEELGNKSEQLKGVAGEVVDWMGLDRLGGSENDPDTTPEAPSKEPRTSGKGAAANKE